MAGLTTSSPAMTTTTMEMSPVAWACLNSSMLEGSELSEGGDEHSRQLSLQVEHYVLKRGIPIISALGLVGNFLSLLVLTKEKLYKSLTKMEISAHIGLIALAVSDLLFCLMVLLVTTLPLRERYQPGDLLVYFDLLKNGLITIFIITSTWLIVVMAAERYVAVCHPLRARNLISLCRTRAYVIVLFVLCPLCTVPVFLERFIERTTCEDGRVVLTVDNVSRDSVVVRRIVWALGFDFVPCAALVYFNTCLIWKIHRAKQLRERMAPLQSFSAASSPAKAGAGGKGGGAGGVGGAGGPPSSCLHSAPNVRKFRWDGSNTKGCHNHNHPRCNGCGGGVGKGCCRDRDGESGSLLISSAKKAGGGGGGAGGGGGGARRSKHALDAHAEDLLHESSESNDQSHSRANSIAGGVGVGGGAGGELRREMQLMCQQGTNGVVKVSSRLSPSMHCRNAQCRQNRSLSSKRRFSDNALNSVTATLVAVVLTFLILVSPWELLKFGLQYSATPVDRYKLDIAMNLTNFMLVLNFSFNFALYCVVNKSFRNTLRKLICFQTLTKHGR